MEATPTADVAAERRGLLSFVWGVYKHVLAVLGAFSLAAFLGNLINTEWHGLIATILHYWDIYVRPVMAWVFHVLITVPLGWFQWQVEVPLWVRDYIASGIILTASTARSARGSRIRNETGLRYGRRYHVLVWLSLHRVFASIARTRWRNSDGLKFEAIPQLLIIAAIMVVMWPAWLVFVLYGFASNTAAVSRRAQFLTMSPFIYLIIIFAVNAISPYVSPVLRAITGS